MSCPVQSVVLLSEAKANPSYCIRSSCLGWYIKHIGILLVRCGTHICQCQSSNRIQSHCLSITHQIPFLSLYLLSELLLGFLSLSHRWFQKYIEIFYTIQFWLDKVLTWDPCPSRWSGSPKLNLFRKESSIWTFSQCAGDPKSLLALCKILLLMVISSNKTQYTEDFHIIEMHVSYA